MDAIELEIVRNLLWSIAEEMGSTLQRTAFSPNIKERRDFSCAIFDENGDAAILGDHMPVHLGSMPMSVKCAVSELEFKPGDVAILNDPFRGGTHLPDITLVSPVFLSGKEKPDMFLASRAHHSDVGGMSPGSMPIATEIYQEGLIIPPVKIIREGKLDREMLALILANVRTPEERRGDLNAQIAANSVGDKRLREVAARYPGTALADMLAELQSYSERMTRAFISEIPDGEYTFEDQLDNDGISDRPIPIRVKITISGDSATVDFTGTAPQTAGSVNAIQAVTLSAVLYVFKGVIGADVLTNSGILRPVNLVTPPSSVVNASRPAPVAGGNVETSQRIVDVLLGALHKAVPSRVPAASCGTMSNLTFGGIDPRSGKPYAYYETIGGGHGAGPVTDGLNARHTHMTNSLNTPIEALEHAFPVRMERYGIRRGSGGAGAHRGGDGIVRSYRFLSDTSITLLAERHVSGPYGLAGGERGKPGKAEIRRGGETINVPSKWDGQLQANDVLSIETPGGGGYGTPN